MGEEGRGRNRSFESREGEIGEREMEEVEGEKRKVVGKGGIGEG